MRRLYAVGFECHSGTPGELATALVKRSEEYCHKYTKEVRTVRRLEGEHGLWTLECVLPNYGDQLVIRIARSRNDVGFSVELLAPDAAIRPSDWAPRHLSLVNDILDLGPWTNLTGTVEQTPFDVSERAAFDLASKVIRDPKRRHPVVVITKDRHLDGIFVDDMKLAASLAGIARVYVLENKPATHNLSETLGETLGVHSGSIRIYWPGFSRRDNPRFHPLLFGSDLKQMPPGEAEDLVRAPIIAAARDQFTEGPVHSAARKALAEHALKLLDGMGLKELQAKVRDLEAESEAKDDVAQAMQLQINALRAIVGRAGREKAIGPADCRTADEVLRLAESRFQHLSIGKNAWKAADGYGSRHLDELYDVLEALEDLAREKENGQLGKSLESWFNAWGQRIGRKLAKFAGHESETTKGMHGDERDFATDKGKVRMTKHFTIGKGDSEGCMQVYWDFASAGIQIGYVGPHLSYATMR